MNQEKIKLHSCPGEISKLESFLQCVTKRFHIKDDKYPDMLISLTEAVNNAIIHGNGSDKSKFVKVTCSEKAKNEIVFKISDEGTGFNPSSVPDPTNEELLECCGGRGVHIMKCLSDELTYSGNGNVVLLKFKL